MNVPVWAAALSADFWRAVNEADRFPRELRGSIPRALPLSIFLMADLTLFRIQEWLKENEVACELGTANRRLRAGLIAWGGHGIAFVDGRDADDEQRFSLAHELAHFLRDYWRPRSQVEARLGPLALDVVDGRRAATAEEQFQSLVHFAPMGFRVHLLDRDADGEPAGNAIATAEEDADRLAYELLAPAEHILANVANLQDRDALREALMRNYGFPSTKALRYAAILIPPPRRSDPLLRQLSIFT